MKNALICAFLALALAFAGCVQQQTEPTTAPTAAPTAEPTLAPTAEPSATLVGGDRDEHGCIPSAGYSWCEEKQKCLRSWEEECVPAPSPSPAVPSLEELKNAIEPVAEEAMGYKMAFEHPDARQWIANDATRPLSFKVVVELPIVNKFDYADYIITLTGPKTNATKRVALLYSKMSNAYFDYQIKQFCYGAKYLVTSYVREPIYPNLNASNYGEKLASAIIDVCPE